MKKKIFMEEVTSWVYLHLCSKKFLFKNCKSENYSFSQNVVNDIAIASNKVQKWMGRVLMDEIFMCSVYTMLWMY
jgi:hypothetical protein